MGYKIGDWVKVREDMTVNEQYGCLNYLDGMQKYAGTYHKVTAVENGGQLLRLHCCAFFWAEEMLLPVKFGELRGGDVIRFTDNYDSWSKMPDGVRDQYLGKVVTIRDDGWAVQDVFQIDGDEYFFDLSLVADKFVSRQQFENAAAKSSNINELRKILWS